MKRGVGISVYGTSPGSQPPNLELPEGAGLWASETLNPKVYYHRGYM